MSDSKPERASKESPEQKSKFGAGFGVSGFRVQGLGFRVWGLGFEAFGFRVQGLGFRVSRFRALGFGFRPSGIRVDRVSNLGLGPFRKVTDWFSLG